MKNFRANRVESQACLSFPEVLPKIDEVNEESPEILTPHFTFQTKK